MPGLVIHRKRDCHPSWRVTESNWIRLTRDRKGLNCVLTSLVHTRVVKRPSRSDTSLKSLPANGLRVYGDLVIAEGSDALNFLRLGGDAGIEEVSVWMPAVASVGDFDGHDAARDCVCEDVPFA